MVPEEVWLDGRHKKVGFVSSLGHATGDEMGTGRAVRCFKAVHRPVGRSAPARRILRTVCSTAISTAVTYVIYVFLFILVCRL